MAVTFGLTFDCADPELGASKLRVADEEVDDRYHVVMQDPEGNEFCLR